MLGYPKHGGKDEENLTHFFRHYHTFRIKYPFCLFLFYSEIGKMRNYIKSGLRPIVITHSLLDKGKRRNRFLFSSVYPSSWRTRAEMALPSAFPARRLVAVPITLPISFILVAPTSAMMARTSFSSSSGESCCGRYSS